MKKKLYFNIFLLILDVILFFKKPKKQKPVEKPVEEPVE
jgi:hypothetical protein